MVRTRAETTCWVRSVELTSGCVDAARPRDRQEQPAAQSRLGTRADSVTSKLDLPVQFWLCTLETDHLLPKGKRHMELQLAGKRALVTGSTGGLGEEIAKVLAAEGAAVIVHGRDRARAESVAKTIR